MKFLKSLLLSVFLFLIINIPLCKATELRIYTYEAFPAIEAIQKIPEIQDLIDEVQKRGSIEVRVESMPHENFDAFWDGDHRLIRINAVFNRTLGRMISSLLFELHNAHTNDRLQQLCNLAKENKIGIDEFVRNVEKMEHQNAMRTSLLLDKGIHRGIFPKESRWPVFHNFEDHYKVQQLHGHSQWIANHYQKINLYSHSQTFHGTIEGLSFFSDEDKKDMLRLLAIKNDLENPLAALQDKGFKALTRELHKIEGCLLGTTSGNCSRAYQRAVLLLEIFEGNPSFEKCMHDSPLYDQGVLASMIGH